MNQADLIKALLSSPEIEVQWMFVSSTIEGMLINYALARGDDPELIWRAETVMLQPGDSLPHQWICDASLAPETALALQGIAFGEQHLRGRALSLRGVKTGTDAAVTDAVKPLGAEQSNTLFVFGQQLVGKLLRKVEPGASLEEVLRTQDHAAAG